MNATRIDFPQAWRSFFSHSEHDATPPWVRLLMTVIFSTAVAVPFTLLGMAMNWVRGSFADPAFWLQAFGLNLVVSLSIGLAIHAVFSAAFALLGRSRIAGLAGVQRRLFFALLPLVGVAIGWPVGMTLIGVDVGRLLGGGNGEQLLRILLLMGLITFVFQLIFASKARAIEAERSAAEARLRLLQGQMEPHFLFNTLGTVLSLIDTDAPQARRMLETLIDYLRCSLGKLRSGDSTLGEEFHMAEAYLSLMQVRMGERLTFAFDMAEPALARAALPPLLLQPLVENAIHHGLECKVDGGTVQVRARREGSQLVIEVADDGLGSREQPLRRAGFQGNGVALDNLRARLRSRWGAKAVLTLDLQPEAGARATLRLPMETAPCPAP